MTILYLDLVLLKARPNAERRRLLVQERVEGGLLDVYLVHAPGSRLINPELPSQSVYSSGSLAPVLRAHSGVRRAGFAPASQMNQTSRLIAQALKGVRLRIVG